MDDYTMAMTLTRARLVPTDRGCFGLTSSKRVFRPLVVRPAILYREAGADVPWRVDTEGELFLPACPTTEESILDVVRFHESFGRTCRIAAALAMPADSSCTPLRRPARLRRQRIDMFGWAIMFQRDGMHGTALVDCHDSHDRLPAFYECPLQLIDRSAYLTARGIRHRPLAIVVRPEDLEHGAAHAGACGGEKPGNDGRLRIEPEGPRPCSIAELLRLGH